MSFRENGKDIRAFEVAYFTASCDKEEVTAKFAKSLELDYPILSDPTYKTAQAYGMAKPPIKWICHPRVRTALGRGLADSDRDVIVKPQQDLGCPAYG